MRVRPLPLIATTVVLCLGLVTACTGKKDIPEPSGTTASPGPVSSAGPVSAPAPVIVEPLPVAGVIDEVTATLAEAFAAEGPQRNAALTAALTQAGLPILDGAGEPLAVGADGELGLPHWHVAASTATTSDFWLTLQDFTRLIEVTLDEPRSPQPSDGDVELQALLAAWSSPTAEVKFLPGLIDATSVRLGGASLWSTESAADIRMDAPTLEVALGTLSQALWDGPAFERPEPPAPEQPVTVGVDCTDDGMDNWSRWAIEQLAGGVELPHGNEWKGIWERAVEEAENRGEAPAGTSGTVGRTIKRINTANNVAELLTAIYSMGTLTAEVKLVGPARLERVRVAIPEGGARAKLRITIKSKAPTDPEMQKAVNCLLALTSAFGSSTSIPADRRPNVGVRVDGGREFGSNGGGFGFYANTDQPGGGGRPQQALDSLITDEEGNVTVPVMGLPRKTSVPDDVPPRDVDATIHVTAAAEEVTGGGLIQSFLGGVLCAMLPEDKCAASSVGFILRTMKFHLGQFPFPVRDYAPPRWMVIGEITGDEGHFQAIGAISCTDLPSGRWAFAHSPWDDLRYTPELLLSHLTRGDRPYKEGDTSVVDSVTADEYGEEISLVGEGGAIAGRLRVHVMDDDRPIMRFEAMPHLSDWQVLMTAVPVPATDPMPGPCKGLTVDDWKDEWYGW